MFIAHLLALLGLLVDLARVAAQSGNVMPSDAPPPTPDPERLPDQAPLTPAEALYFGSRLVTLLKGAKVRDVQLLQCIGSGIIEQRAWLPSEHSALLIMSGIDITARTLRLTPDAVGVVEPEGMAAAVLGAAKACGLLAFLQAARPETKAGRGSRKPDATPTPKPLTDKAPDADEAPPV